MQRLIFTPSDCRVWARFERFSLNAILELNRAKREIMDYIHSIALSDVTVMKLKSLLSGGTTPKFTKTRLVAHLIPNQTDMTGRNNQTTLETGLARLF